MTMDQIQGLDTEPLRLDKLMLCAQIVHNLSWTLPPAFVGHHADSATDKVAAKTAGAAAIQGIGNRWQ